MLQFLTAKPVVYLVNMSERDYQRKKNKWLPKLFEWVKASVVVLGQVLLWCGGAVQGQLLLRGPLAVVVSAPPPIHDLPAWLVASPAAAGGTCVQPSGLCLPVVIATLTSLHIPPSARALCVPLALTAHRSLHITPLCPAVQAHGGDPLIPFSGALESKLLDMPEDEREVYCKEVSWLYCLLLCCLLPCCRLCCLR